MYVEFKVGRADNMSAKLKMRFHVLGAFQSSAKCKSDVDASGLGVGCGVLSEIPGDLAVDGSRTICQGACQRVAGFRANWMRMPPVSRGMEC